MATYEIPLAPAAQSFLIVLAGKQYRLSIYWGTVAGVWVLDIQQENGTPIISGIPLVTGTDLLSPFPYMEFGGTLIAMTDNDPDSPPTYRNLGSTGHLRFVTT